MRVFLSSVALVLAVGCAANPTPVPDYPMTDEAMQTDVEMLGMDLEPPAVEEASGEAAASEDSAE